RGRPRGRARRGSRPRPAGGGTAAVPGVAVWRAASGGAGRDGASRVLPQALSGWRLGGLEDIGVDGGGLVRDLQGPEVEAFQQLPVVLEVRVAGGEQLVAHENGVGAGEEAQGL